MTRIRQKRDTKPRRDKIQRLVGLMTDGQIIAWEELLQTSPAVEEIDSFLRECGFSGDDLPSYPTIRRFLEEKLTGQKVLQIREILRKYHGTNEIELAEFGALELFQVISRLINVMQFESLTHDDALRNLPGYMQQLKGMTESLNKIRKTKLSYEIALEACESTIAEFQIAFQDTAIEDAIKEVARGARRKIKDKWIGE